MTPLGKGEVSSGPEKTESYEEDQPRDEESTNDFFSEEEDCEDNWDNTYEEDIVDNGERRERMNTVVGEKGEWLSLRR
ncbi:hypothetical protein OUZ56_007396 [Daphnia magna]|uniref:Uncharacterized protein n=1 Tax=Daphnia magna TaxID=35525 RepID=A0ABR0A9U8_9CRUS|nr:hypothetical protein OUZ56_007396 [Daphnia magna]